MGRDEESSSSRDEVSFEISVEDEPSSSPGDGKQRVTLPDGKTLDLTAEQQARIDLLYDGIEDKTYYDILRIKRDAPSKAVKRAYYQFSKEFHPDKFFRKQLGPYKERLELIFAKVNEAYRTLTDDRARDDYDAATFGDEAGDGKLSMATHEVDFVGDAMRGRAQRSRQVQARKKKRKAPAYVDKAKQELVERLKKARRAKLKGQRLHDEGQYLEAAAMFQRALILNPRDEDAAKLAKRSNDMASNSRAEAVWRRGREAQEREQFQEAARLFKQAVEANPSKGKYYHSFGKVVWEHTMRQRTAIEMFRLAVEKDPHILEYVLELARAYESVGMPSNALKAFERAATLDPSNGEARKALKRLR